MFELNASGGWTAAIEEPVAARAGMEAALFMRVLDEIDYGVVLVDAQCVVRYANQLARREMQAGGPLRLADGRVSGMSPGEHVLLAGGIGDAQRGRRRLFTLGHNGSRVSVAAVPMPGDDGDTEMLVMLVFGKRPDNDTLSIDFYARSHGLTGAELTVLKRMAGGLKPKEVAREQGVAISTVRSHICSIRTKTQTGSIRELLNRVATLPPITPVIRRAPPGPVVSRMTH